MRKAEICQKGMPAGLLEELEDGKWRFTYSEGFSGEPVSLSEAIEAIPMRESWQRSSIF